MGRFPARIQEHVWTKQTDPAFRQENKTLQIEEVSPEDAAIYTCSVKSTLKPSDGKANTWSQTGTLSVIVHCE